MSKTSSTAFIGDREYTLRLDRKMVAQLERITGCGFGLLHRRVSEGFFHHSDLVEAIRLGLIGGGLDPAEAKRVVDVWIEDRPIRETYPVAADVMNALWRGPKPAEPETVSGSEDENEFVTRDDSADEPEEAPAPATYGALVELQRNHLQRERLKVEDLQNIKDAFNRAGEAIVGTETQEAKLRARIKAGRYGAELTDPDNEYFDDLIGAAKNADDHIAKVAA